MECFEILLCDKTKSGKVMSREIVHEKGYYHAGIMVFVLDELQNVLFQKRALSKDSNPGKWDVSCAGHVQVGESFYETARRELSEELGLSVLGEELIEIGEVDICYEAKFHNKIFIENEYDKIYICKVQRNIGMVLQKDEVQEIKWISIMELQQMRGLDVHCINSEVLDIFLEYMNVPVF